MRNAVKKPTPSTRASTTARELPMPSYNYQDIAPSKGASQVVAGNKANRKETRVDVKIGSLQNLSLDR
jgi:hypothetical protein